MKWIEDAGFYAPKSGGKRRRQSRFQCVHCQEIVVRDHDAGLKHKSCGCVQYQTITKHGYAKNGAKRGPYKTWGSIWGRCASKRDAMYRNYGARGIRVCDEWRDAFTFCKWAMENGWKPGLQIDRINNDGNYEPSNCRFVTAQVNAHNRRGLKLSEKIGDMIRCLLDGGFLQADIFRLSNAQISRSSLSLIARGKLWRPVPI